MAKRKTHSKRGGSQRAKFGKAARKCWTKLRAGNLPKKGQFGKCMKAELK
jgi:hypothetical protein